MTTTVQVPLNTMLADLDEGLRQLLRRELGRHGFDGVEIAFDAPSKEWSGKLSLPTVSLFMYELRESLDRRAAEWRPEPGNGRLLRPPLRLDAFYAVTAWTREVEDEHRLLSQVLGILYAYPSLPGDVLAGTLADEAMQPLPLETRVGQERADGKADFWTAVGGQYKASVDYVVTLSCASGTALERGPAVETHTVRTRDRDLPRASAQDIHRVGGTVRGSDGEPVRDAWVALPDGPYWTSTDADGRFRLSRLRAGRYRVFVRGPDGAHGEAELEVPGSADITLRRRHRHR